MSPMSFKRATAIQFGSKYLAFGVQFVLTMILARLLTPEEYGTVAIVTVFLTFFTMLADLGISPAVVQFKDLDDEDLSALFFFSLLLGVGLAALFCVLSFAIAAIYASNQLVPLCCFASISVFFGAANMVPNGILLRDKRFGVIGVRSVVTALVGGAVAIVAALCGGGCYALVANTVISSLLVFAWNAATARVAPRNVHFMAPLRRIFSFSAYQFGFSFINYFSRNFDNMLIGWVFGSVALGFYEKAYKLTTYPVSLIPSTLSPVIQPYLSEYRNHPERLYSYYVRIAKVLSIVGIYVTLVFFFAARELVFILFGSQWEETVPLFRALSASVMVQLVGNISGSVLQSTGRTDYMFRIGIVNTCITLIFLIVGVLSGDLLVTACCVSTAFCLHIAAIVYYVVHRALGQKASGFAREFAPELVALVAVGCALSALSVILPEGIWIPLLAKVAICTVLYLAIMLVFGQKRYFDFLAPKRKTKASE